MSTDSARVYGLFLYHVVQHVLVVACRLDYGTVLVVVSLWSDDLLHAISHRLVSLVPDVRVLYRIRSNGPYTTRIHVTCSYEVYISIEVQITWVFNVFG